MLNVIPPVHLCTNVVGPAMEARRMVLDLDPDPDPLPWHEPK